MINIKSFCNKLCCGLHKKCCICLNEEKIGINCKLCSEGIICINCVSKLCESGLCRFCPVCRSPNWKQNVMSKFAIIPISEKYTEPLPTVQIIMNEDEKKGWECPPCSRILDRIGVFIAIIFVSYILGIFTIYVFDNDSDIMTKPGLNLLPLPIGLFELAVCCHCCYRCLIDMDE